MGWRFAIFALFVLSAAQASAAPASLSFGPSIAPLNTPWKFHTGDDPRWAASDFDDAQWEAVDLTPKPGAHDGDVGLKNYVGGWSEKGHRGYTGYAWYRMAVSVADPGSDALWLVGPAAVDNAYQIFLNGHLIGGVGDFSRSPPNAGSIKPRLYALPRALWNVRDGHWTGVIAIRASYARGTFGTGADAGGIHIAPLLGNEKGARDHYQLQWLQTVEGYTVDAVEPIVFLILAIMALTLMPFDPKDRFYPWLAIALVLLGAARANQPFYFLAEIETMRGFAFWRLAVIDALTFAAWTITWQHAFRQGASSWIAIAAGVLAAIYLIARLLTLSMLVPGVPHGIAVASATVLQFDRLGFLVLMLYLAVRGVLARALGIWLALASFVCMSVGLFAQELSVIGVPGIWFPFGVGVSRTEYAYAAFAAVMFFYLLQRLWSYAPTATRRGWT